MTHATERDRAEFELWSQANNKYHVSGYNPHNDLWEAWQAADNAARQREMQLLSEIEALEKLALANLKQKEVGA